MIYAIAGGVLLLGAWYLWRLYLTADIRKIVKAMRWFAGAAVAALTLFLLFRGQIFIATITGPIAYGIFTNGRIGRFSFGSDAPSGDTASTVKSRFFAMTLDHDSGEVVGRVIGGRFKGRDLFDLGEDETRLLLAEIGGDADSLSLLETWLDRNRAGWREYFGESEAGPAAAGVAADPDAEAFEVLGLEPGAGPEEIRAAHRGLMMKLHPDQGGSNYLATKINAAKDQLLRKRRV
ncbi:MAG: molecular chaperone DnaJ [Devosia sp.]|nr:molecular chaperone DnaJ [Devosia sp.]